MIATIISNKELYNLLPDTYEAIQALKGDLDNVCLSAIQEYYEENFGKKFPLLVIEVPVFSSKKKSHSNICSRYFVVGVPWEKIPEDATKKQVEDYIRYHLKDIWKIPSCKISDIDVPVKDLESKKYELFMDYIGFNYVSDCFREWLDKV